MKIGVIGLGAYSLAISLMLNKNDNDITIWSEAEDKIETIKRKGQIDYILPDIKIPSSLKFTTDLEIATKDKDIIFIIVAAQYVGNISRSIKDYITEDTIICIGTKGIEQDSCKFIDKVVLKEIKTKNLAVISGPTFAIDLAKGEPAAISLASHSKKALETIPKVLATDNLKIRTTEDVIGLEICGSIKNVIAIAAGIIDGLGYGETTQAFLITEALHDIKSLIKELGGEKNTILSYAGIGDLLLTCTSTKSRNFTYGTLLGQKAPYKEIERYLIDNTVEGYYTLKSIYKLINDEDIDLETINLIYDIIFNQENPDILIEFLISKK